MLRSRPRAITLRQQRHNHRSQICVVIVALIAFAMLLPLIFLPFIVLFVFVSFLVIVCAVVWFIERLSPTKEPFSSIDSLHLVI